VTRFSALLPRWISHSPSIGFTFFPFLSSTISSLVVSLDYNFPELFLVESPFVPFDNSRFLILGFTSSYSILEVFANFALIDCSISFQLTCPPLIPLFF